MSLLMVNPEEQLISKLLLKVSIQKIRNSMVSPSGEGAPKESREKDHSFIIGDSTLFNILPPKLKKYDLSIQDYVWV